MRETRVEKSLCIKHVFHAMKMHQLLSIIIYCIVQCWMSCMIILHCILSCGGIIFAWLLYKQNCHYACSKQLFFFFTQDIFPPSCICYPELEIAWCTVKVMRRKCWEIPINGILIVSAELWESALGFVEWPNCTLIRH